MSEKDSITRLREIAEYFDFMLNSPGHDERGAGHEIDIDTVRRIYDELLLFLPMDRRDKYRNRPETWKTRTTRRITIDVKELIQEVEQITEPAPEPIDFWKAPIDKKKLWRSLADAGLITYKKGAGKPEATLQNALYIMRALYDLQLIDESLIRLTHLTKEEKWNYAFIESEFEIGGDRVRERLAQAKRYHFNDKSPDREFLETIKTIIKNSLT